MIFLFHFINILYSVCKYPSKPVKNCFGDMVLSNLNSNKAEQVNGKANNMDNVSDFGKLLLKDTEMINFADEKKFKAM